MFLFTFIQVPSWLGEHYLGWSVDWRELFGFSNTVPLSIREQGGHSLKSSVKVYIFTTIEVLYTTKLIYCGWIEFRIYSKNKQFSLALYVFIHTYVYT